MSRVPAGLGEHVDQDVEQFDVLGGATRARASPGCIDRQRIDRRIGVLPTHEKTLKTNSARVSSSVTQSESAHAVSPSPTARVPGGEAGRKQFAEVAGLSVRQAVPTSPSKLVPAAL